MKALLLMLFLGQMVYDPTTVERYDGEITAIEENRGVHLTLETSQGNFFVRLGPKWYVDQQSMKLHIGDEVEVTGSRKNSTIIAARVRKGSEEMTLRSLNGVPRWSRGKVPN